MISLGIDPSTKTGVAVVSDFDILFTREISNNLRGIDRAIEISRDVEWAIDNFKPDVCVIEGYGYANTHTLATLVEIGTLIRLAIKMHNVPFYVVPPACLKKFVTGKGNSKKDAMILDIYKRFNFETRNNNIADAVGLAFAGQAIEGSLAFNLPKANLSALDKCSDLH